MSFSTWEAMDPPTKYPRRRFLDFLRDEGCATRAMVG